MARTHTELIAWQLAHELKLAVYGLIESGPITRNADLREQLRRSASNAPRNIAEGFGRYLPDDFIRYLRFANGELRETYEGLQDGCDRRCFTREQVLPLQRLSKRASKAASRLIAYLKTANAPGEPRRRSRSAREPNERNERNERNEPNEPNEPKEQEEPSEPQRTKPKAPKAPKEPQEPQSTKPKAPKAPKAPQEPEDPWEPMD